jgi:hypothetical protein
VGEVLVRNADQPLPVPAWHTLLMNTPWMQAAVVTAFES